MKRENLKFDGLKNIRDIGGITVPDGRMVGNGRILRSDSLHALSAGDVEILQERYHLSLIIDLRTKIEIEEMPDVRIGQCRLLHIPVFPESVIGLTREKGLKGLVGNAPDIRENYRHMVSDPFCIRQLERIVKEIIGCEEGGVLYHCSAGKDRTGLVTMLLYGLLGVAAEDILSDYTLSNAFAAEDAKKQYEKILKETGDRGLAERIRQSFLADPSFLQGAIDRIAENYDDLHDYCRRALHISEQEEEGFRARMLYQAKERFFCPAPSLPPS